MHYSSTALHRYTLQYTATAVHHAHKLFKGNTGCLLLKKIIFDDSEFGGLAIYSTVLLSVDLSGRKNAATKSAHELVVPSATYVLYLFYYMYHMGAFTYEYGGIFDLPTYPNPILYYISLFSNIRCSLTYLPS